MTAGFGRDMWCFDAIQPGRFVSGRALLAQALYRRLTTPRGVLRGVGRRAKSAATYGLDLVGYVGAVGTRVAVAALPGLVRAECLKDDRVADVVVTVKPATAPNGLTTLAVELAVTPASDLESFALTINVSTDGAAVAGLQ